MSTKTIDKPELTAQEESRKKEYQSKGWRFKYSPGMPGWEARKKAGDGSDSKLLLCDTIQSALDRIGEVENDDGKIAGDDKFAITDVFTEKDFQTFQTNEFYSEFEGKSLDEINKLLLKNYPKNWDDKQKSAFRDAGYAAQNFEKNKMLLERDEKIVFKQGGSFILNTAEKDFHINFFYDPGRRNLVFDTNNVPNPITRTGYRSDYTDLLNYDSVGAMIEKRVRIHVADTDNPNTDRKEKAQRKKTAASLEILNLKFEKTGLDERAYFHSLKRAEPAEDQPDHAELHRRAVKSAKSEELVRNVIVGADNVNRVKSALETTFGNDWYELSKHWRNDEEFKAEVKSIWLGELEGDKALLMENYLAEDKTADAEPSGESAENIDDLRRIPIEDIVPSPLEPQKLRREHFIADEITEISESVKEYGLINAITVRPKNGKFEIVAGERRWLAVKQAGLSTIRAVVRELSDEATEDLQLLENLQRADLHPLDEASWYKHLQETRSMSLTDIALKISKSESHVAHRLKMNELCTEAKKDFAEGFLPIGHATEVAKYDGDTQKLILNKVVYLWNVRENGTISLPKLKEKIESEIHLSLKRAPFSLKATDLREDKLACINCSQRTGANPVLFERSDDEAEDNCLNRSCFIGKVNEHIKQVQFRETESVKQAKADTDYVAPLLSTWYSSSGNDEFPTAIGTKAYETIERKKDACASAEYGIFVNDNRVGQRQLICRNPTCETHGKSIRPDTSSVAGKDLSPEVVEFNRKQRLKRKEEIFDCKVAALVRVRVLKLAAEKFEGFKSAEPEFLRPMVQRLWNLQNSRDSAVTEALSKPVAEYFGIKKTKYWHNEVNKAIDDDDRFEKLDLDKVRQIAFLLLHGHLDPIYYFEERGYQSDSYRSQKFIRQIADEYGIDYMRLDAEARLNVAAMKNKDVFRAHLNSIEAGNYSDIPRIWSSEWKPKD